MGIQNHIDHHLELGWGNFVYILGFPIGSKMVTRGIISKAPHDSRDDFMIDALFNRGSSGGIILAVRDGIPNFELIGLAKSVSSKSEVILVPTDNLLDVYNAPQVPYQGDVYIQKESRINYGLTYAVSARSLKKFFMVNEQLFLSKGYSFNHFTGISD